MMSQLTPTIPLREQVEQLQEELNTARRALQEAEAILSAEQAAVNAFRMHCRLKIGDLVEVLLEMQAQKQALLTRLELRHQAAERGIPYDPDDPFWQEETLTAARDGPLLPTPTPHDKEAEKRLYRQLARRFHPDLAANTVERAYCTSIMAAVNVAYERGDVQALRNLAGELDPDVAAALSGGETAEIRRLRKLLLSCKRRRRKVAEQARALREENTARLWRKARQLEDAGLNWWDEVRLELDGEIERLHGELAALEKRAELLDPA
ncbi:MAG: hypothetical protein KC418_17005 [Anaerolineales bacterium]|nr:hypothetical protein [Anaerolineales bacterium]MCB8954004.1 hypothetical protein [Ardenticatenales bacterium]